jgi:hypothetical protein
MQKKETDGSRSAFNLENVRVEITTEDAARSRAGSGHLDA